MTFFHLLAITTGIALALVLTMAAYELRAIRKVLQARWDYDRYKLWLEIRGESSATYRRVAPSFLRKPRKLPDMS